MPERLLILSGLLTSGQVISTKSLILWRVMMLLSYFISIMDVAEGVMI